MWPDLPKKQQAPSPQRLPNPRLKTLNNSRTIRRQRRDNETSKNQSTSPSTCLLNTSRIEANFDLQSPLNLRKQTINLSELQNSMQLRDR